MADTEPPDDVFPPCPPLLDDEEPSSRDEGPPPTLAIAPEVFAALDDKAKAERFAALREDYVHLWRERAMQQWIFDDLQRNLGRFSRLAQILAEFDNADLDALARRIVEEMPSLFGARFGSLYLRYSDGRLERVRATVPVDGPAAYDPARDAYGFAMALTRRGGQAEAIFDLEAYCAGHAPPLTPPDESALLGAHVLACPLSVKSAHRTRPVGLLLMGDKNEPFTPDEIESCGLIADVLAVTLTNALLMEELAGLAHTDALTGIANRRSLDEELERQIAFARHYGHPLSVLIADIDFFKRVNDTHGHAVGDEVLRHLAKLMAGAVHDKLDTVARYGGEEFVVILPHTGLKEAAIVAERLRRKVEASPWQGGGVTVDLTISVGAAGYGPGCEARDLVAAADDALYRAKRDGRNRVCAAEME